MSFTKVSVLVPTRGRLDRLKTLLESYRLTTQDSPESSELVFRIDDDDEETKLFLASRAADVASWFIGPRYQGYRSMPVFFNEMRLISSGDVLMCGSDDMVFQTKGWAGKILETANQYPDGVFDLGVKTHNEKHYPFSIVSRKVTDVLGFFWDPRIYWGDIYLRDIMGSFDRLIYMPEVEVEHDWAGWKPDQTFVEADQTSIYQRDPNYWANTHTPAVNEAVAKLKAYATR